MPCLRLHIDPVEIPQLAESGPGRRGANTSRIQAGSPNWGYLRPKSLGLARNPPSLGRTRLIWGRFRPLLTKCVPDRSGLARNQHRRHSAKIDPESTKTDPGSTKLGPKSAKYWPEIDQGADKFGPDSKEKPGIDQIPLEVAKIVREMAKSGMNSTKGAPKAAKFVPPGLNGGGSLDTCRAASCHHIRPREVVLGLLVRWKFHEAHPVDPDALVARNAFAVLVTSLALGWGTSGGPGSI